jgi:hypothetical protein
MAKKPQGVPFPEQVKCLYPLHHGWHSRENDCVYPMARSEFSGSTLQRDQMDVADTQSEKDAEPL